MGLHDVQAFEMVNYYLLREKMDEQAATYADSLVERGASIASPDDIERLAFFSAAIMNSALVTQTEPRTEPTQADLALWQLVESVPFDYLTAMYERGVQPGPVTVRLACRLYHGGFPKEKVWAFSKNPMAWRMDDILALKDAPAQFFRDFGPFVKGMNAAEVRAVAASGISADVFSDLLDEGVEPFEIVRLAADLPADFMASIS